MPDGLPADAELQSLAAPEGAPPYLTLVDDGATLAGRPRPWPAALYWASMSLPLGGWGAALVLEWNGLLGSPDPLFRGAATPVTVLMVLVTAVGWFGFRWLNRHTIRMDDFFSLDRAAGTLALPRAGVTLRRGAVAEVVEVHAWHRVRDAEGSSADYLAEVSVLALGPAGRLTRHAVVVAGHVTPVGLVATSLSGAFGVPHRKLVESHFGGSWRRMPGQQG